MGHFIFGSPALSWQKWLKCTKKVNSNCFNWQQIIRQIWAFKINFWNLLELAFPWFQYSSQLLQHDKRPRFKLAKSISATARIRGICLWYVQCRMDAPPSSLPSLWDRWRKACRSRCLDALFFRAVINCGAALISFRQNSVRFWELDWPAASSASSGRSAVADTLLRG